MEVTISPTSVPTAIGGYNGYADISSQVSDIQDKIIVSIPVGCGRTSATNLGGYCFMQSNTIVRLSTNSTNTEKVKVVVIYTK